MTPFPAKQGLSSTQEGPGCLKSRGQGNKGEVANTQEWCVSTEIVDAGWEELGSESP